MNEFEKGRMKGHEEVTSLLNEEALLLMEEAWKARALGQEATGKLMSEQAKKLLSLIAALPTRLRSER